MKSSDRFSALYRNLWLTAGAFALFALVFVFYVRSEKRIDLANEKRFLSYVLADELRESSDDLTRMVRTYVITGEPIYKKHYQEILDIRDGKQPRPLRYEYIYWDLVSDDDLRPRPSSGVAVPLLELMQRIGFTDEEFGRLAQAKANSDALTRTEFAAMALVESHTQPAKADSFKASLMLHDHAYHLAKAGIMQPISEFQQMMDLRTLKDVHAAELFAASMRAVFILFGIILMFMLWRSYRALQAILGGSANELHAHIARLGSGDFATPIPIVPGTEQSVLGWLSTTQQKLEKIELERTEATQRIQYLAHFDILTGLPNRAQLDDHLNYALSLAKRSNGRLAIMFLDLDHFKDINDTLGHSIGDTLLIELAKRIKSVLREEDTASRLGGDEFILMLPGTDAPGAARVAQKLLAVITQPCEIEQHELTVTASIGIALYPEDGANLETLSKNADAAMYRVKQDGRQGYRFFTQEMQTRSTRNLQLVNALRHALERNQLQLHYQPQICIQDGRVVGAEALLRWQHPELGSISPAEFVSVAEDSGLILPIGEWVVRTAVQQAKEWFNKGHSPMVIAVNLSAVQFRHPDLPELVSRILSEAGLPPEYLELELTEGVAMHDPQSAIAVMNDLHERGVRMSIDDFGTGYSSLSYLKKFKVYKLKIDQSFVRDINTDSEDRAIVSAVINLARSLGLRTIAEGVETPGQLAFLIEQGCNEVQGYYYSKPLVSDQFEEFVWSRE